MSENTPNIGDFPIKMESFKHSQTKGKTSIEYWFAREIQTSLGYEKWDNFLGVIEKARENCARIGIDPKHHFAATGKMVEVGSGAHREQVDYIMSRVGCYFVALNADSSKPEIALAKAYFVALTRAKETEGKMLESAEERLKLRERLKEANKLLSGAAKRVGVDNYGYFHDAGIRALYGMKMSALKAKKGLEQGEDYWDRAGALELSANEFKAQLVRESLTKNKVKGQSQAEAEHMRVARVVRKTVHEETGKHLEDIPLEPSLKKFLKASKQEGIGNGKLIPPSSTELGPLA